MPRKVISLLIILAAIAIIAYGLDSKEEVKKTAFDSPIHLVELPESEVGEEPVISAIEKPKIEAVAEIVATEKEEVIAAVAEEGEKIVDEVVAEVKEKVEDTAEKMVASATGIVTAKPLEAEKSVAGAIAAPGAIAAAIAATSKPEEAEKVVAESAAKPEETAAAIAAAAIPAGSGEKVALAAEEAEAKAEEDLTMAPDFTLPTYDGKSLTLSALKGKRGVVLIFFATWCPSCMAEVDEVKAFVEAAKEKDVLVYGISNQEKGIIEKFRNERKINYRLLQDKGSKVARTYQANYIPLTVGIDAAGVVKYYANKFPENAELFIKVLTEPLKAEQ